MQFFKNILYLMWFDDIFCSLVLPFDNLLEVKYEM
jgi:hypothetical protein